MSQPQEEIYTPAASALQTRSSIDRENRIVKRENALAQLDREYSGRQAELIRRETEVRRQERHLQRRHDALGIREAELVQAQEVFRRREADIELRNAEVDRQRRLLQDERQEVARQKELTRRLEEQRRVRRTPSEAFLEDIFPALPMQDVVKNIGNQSLRTRRHTMATLIPLADYTYAHKHQRDFDTLIVALLPTALPLLRPVQQEVLEFIARFLLQKHVCLALARADQCQHLFDVLALEDASASSLAFDALCHVLNGDLSHRRLLHSELYSQLSLSFPESLSKFTTLALPKLIDTVLSDGQYEEAVAYATHPQSRVRAAVHSAIAHAAQAETVQRGLVEADILDYIFQSVRTSDAPLDLIHFAARVLPKLAIEACQAGQVDLLLSMLCHEEKELNTASMLALRSLRQTDADCREALRLGLDPHIWSPSGMDTRIYALALESMQQIAQDMISSARYGDLISYVELKDSALREIFFFVMQESAGQSPELQRQLLEHGLLAKVRKSLIPKDPPADVVSFAMQMLPAFAVEISRSGSTPILLELLQHSHVFLTVTAVGSLRKVLHGDAVCRRALETTLTPCLNTSDASVVEFAVEALPFLANDMISENRFADLVPLLLHERHFVRAAVMPSVLQMIQGSKQHQEQLARAGFMAALSRNVVNRKAPDDILGFAKSILPFTAVQLSEAGLTDELVDLLRVSTLRQTAVDCLINIKESGEMGQQHLVDADFLSKVVALLPGREDCIINLIHELLPTLSVRCCRRGQTAVLIQLSEATSSRVRRAALSSIAAIVASSAADRVLLKEALLPQIGPQEHVLSIVDIALEPIARDLVTSNDLQLVVQLATHAEVRVRRATYPALLQGIRDSADCRAVLTEMGFIPVVAGFCSSPVKDRVEFAACVIPLFATEICRSGLTDTFVKLTALDDRQICQAVYLCLQEICNDQSLGQPALMDAGILVLLSRCSQRARQEDLQFFGSVLPSLAVRIAQSMDHCVLVLRFLAQNNSTVQATATRTLDAMLLGSPSDRRFIREAVLSQLHSNASTNIIQYSARALSNTLCNDCIHESNFTELFSLLSHTNLDVRIAVEQTFRDALRNELMCEKLASEGLFSAVLSLLPAAPSDVLEFSAQYAIPALGPSIVEDGAYCIALIGLLSSPNKGVREGASAAIRRAAALSSSHRHKLVEAGIASRMVAALTTRDQVVLDFVCALLPVLAVELAEANLCDLLLDLLSHQIVNVRRSSLEALRVAIGIEDLRSHFVHPILERCRKLKDPECSFVSEAIVALNETILLTGRERELLHLLWHDVTAVSEASFAAIRGLVINGSSFERRRLLEAQLFQELLRMLGDSHLRASAVVLTLDLLPNLAILMIERGQFDELLHLFNDTEPLIGGALDRALRDICINPDRSLQLVQHDVIPALLGVLDIRRNSKVLELVCYLCQTLAVPLVDFGKADAVVTTLSRPEAEIRNAGIMAIQYITTGGSESLKSALFLTLGLMHGFFHVLDTDRNRYPMMQAACESLANLASTSVNRAKVILASRAAVSLIEICQLPDTDMQLSSLAALNAICSTVIGDKSALLRSGLMTVLVDFLDESPSPKVSQQSLGIILTIAATPGHRREIAAPNLIRAVLKYLQPSDDLGRIGQENQIQALQICKHLADESDQERHILQDAGAFPVLVQLTQHHRMEVVVLTCNIIETIASTGIYRRPLIDAGAPKYLKRPASAVNKYAVATAEEKKAAQKAAQRALAALETGLLSGLSKRLTRKAPHAASLSAGSRHTRSSTEPHG